ncbi:MAG: SUMF1/EgtB/PvdO family nonheme iron enzyme [Candidatus Hydrogenedentes bacterium]|nr:SUMF1/EgtB/PvdO family nonheme iron enzyme [Candidatus Hydrogenedentota bacterium]
MFQVKRTVRGFTVGLSVLMLATRALSQTPADTPPLKPATGANPGEHTTIKLPGGVSLELVWIPAGTFLMGQRDGEQDAYPNKETPQHPVTLSSGYWMGKFEVTKEQWKAVMGTAPWEGRPSAGEDLKTPANYVDWSSAAAFAEALTKVAGVNFRLPTEAEWEYACRAGTTTRFYWGDDPTYDAIDGHAWWRGNAANTELKCPRSVGQKPPNPWGLCDMSGNVSEWCQDWHSFYFGGPATDPAGPAIASHRVLRGGSWITIGGQCRSSRRYHEEPLMARSDIGFRVTSGNPVVRQPGVPEIVDVFVAGSEGVNTYRIPSMLLAPDGTLLAFCEARKESQDDASPTDMVLRRSVDGGRSWLPTQVLVHGIGNEALMNPCAVVDRATNTVLLACMKANKIGPNRNQHFLLLSQDNGQTWSEPMDIGDRIANYNDSFVPGPGVGIQMQSGRLVIPGYAGTPDEVLEENFYSRVLYSDDHGQNWTLGAPVPQFSDESQAVELRDGSLMLNVRGNMGMSCRGVAISENGGETWSRFYWDRALKECPCEASLIRYGCDEKDGKNALLFANPDNSGECYGILERTKMTVRASFDEGKTWPVKRLLHPGPSSYSTMVRLPDGDIGILFEGGEKHRREWIRFARFSMAWLADQG